ncbi:MAG: hypothetical protein ACI4WM_01650 [Erysipelotrichaceae bacterium]
MSEKHHRLKKSEIDNLVKKTRAKELRKDRNAKSIMSDKYNLARAVKYSVPQYSHMSDQEIATLIKNIKTSYHSLNEDYPEKILDVFFQLKPSDKKSGPCQIALIVEPNFYNMNLSEYKTRALDYAVLILQELRKQYGSNYHKGVQVYCIFICVSSKLKGKTLALDTQMHDLLSDDIYNTPEASNIRCVFHFIDDNYKRVKPEYEGASFYSTMFTTRLSGNDKIKVLKEEKNFSFSSQTKEVVIKMSGFEQYYEAVFKERYEEAVAEHNAYVKQTEENSILERYKNVKMLMDKFDCSFDYACDLLTISQESREEIRQRFFDCLN